MQKEIISALKESLLMVHNLITHICINNTTYLNIGYSQVKMTCWISDMALL